MGGVGECGGVWPPKGAREAASFLAVVASFLVMHQRKSLNSHQPTPLQLKFKTIKMREDEAAKLGEAVDAIMKKAETKVNGGRHGAGCFAWVSKLLRSRSYKRSNQYDSEMGQVTTSHSSHSANSADTASTSAVNKSMEVNSRIFGLAGAKKASDPAHMLEQAASVMKARIEQLESRASEQRVEAARLMKAGQKQAAMRALKKAKQLEASVAANSASLDAVEQQVDLLAQAAVQKTLTSALETTSKTMQKDKKMVARAEKAVDDVSEVRDMAEDLNAAMNELANHGANDIDEDELLEELEVMMDQTDAAVDVDDESEFAASSINEKRKLTGNGVGVATTGSTVSATSSTLASLKLPSVPRRKAVQEEKSSLLENDGAGMVGVM